MSVHGLIKSFSNCSIVPRNSKTLAWSRNGVCATARVQQVQAERVESLACETTCGKKIKTRKAVSKRFKVTGGGKILRRRPGKQHINEKMSRNKIRNLGKVVQVEDRDLPNVAPNLPYSGVKQSRN